MTIEQKIKNNLPVTIGVISDTHIPDRYPSFHPDFFEQIRAFPIDELWHAGDISSPRVIRQLEQEFTVKAVRGNRDWLFGQKLPLIYQCDIYGNTIALMHGHGGLYYYLIDKVKFLFSGYNSNRYRLSMKKIAPDAQVVVFGHTHFQLNEWKEKRLLFNPGSVNETSDKRPGQSFGILRFFPNGEVEGEIVRMRKAKWIKRQWVINEN